MVAALAENLPHRSRENEFSAGRVLMGKGQKCPFEFNTGYGFKRVGAGAKTAPLPRRRVAPRWRKERRRLVSFLRRSGMAAVAPERPPTDWPRPHVSKPPKTAAWTGGRAGTGFLPGIQKPAPARLIRPNWFYGCNWF